MTSIRHELRILTAVMTVSLAPIGCWSVANADRPSPDRESKQEESVDRRYARAHLQVAKLDLRQAEEWNKRIPDLFSQRMMDQLRKHVEIDQEQYKQSERGQIPDVHQIYVRGAEAAVQLAKAEVRRKEEYYRLLPGIHSKLELERAQAVTKIAELNLERTRAQKDSIYTLSYLQWQIEELRNQLLELQIRYEKDRAPNK